jgi:DNA-binding NarL/FixJ family response regulator
VNTAAESSKTATPPKITVLIADDVDDLRLLMRFTLEAADFEVIGEAPDGQRAIQLAGALQPNLVLLDLAMPVMDGLTALPHLHEVAPATRVVVFSGFEEDAMAERALALCAYAYLQKGVSSDEIRKVLPRVHESDPKPGQHT